MQSGAERSRHQDAEINEWMKHNWMGGAHRLHNPAGLPDLWLGVIASGSAS